MRDWIPCTLSWLVPTHHISNTHSLPQSSSLQRRFCYDDNKRKRHLERNSHFLKLHRSYHGDGLLILFDFIKFIKCWQNFQGLNRKGPYLSLRKEKGNFCVVFTYSIKREREIRKFHVAVVQRRLKNVQKSVMHVQSCCFENKNPSPFRRSRCRRLRRC